MVTIKKEKQLFLTHNSFYQHGNVASACRENSLDQLGLLQNGNYKMRRNILFQMWEENPKWENKSHAISWRQKTRRRLQQAGPNVETNEGQTLCSEVHNENSP